MRLVSMMRQCFLGCTFFLVVTAQPVQGCPLLTVVDQQAIKIDLGPFAQHDWLSMTLVQLLNTPELKNSRLLLRGLPGNQLKHDACQRLTDKGFLSVAFLQEFSAQPVTLDVSQSLKVLLADQPVYIVTNSDHLEWLRAFTHEHVVTLPGEKLPAGQCVDRYLLGVGVEEMQLTSTSTNLSCGQWLLMTEPRVLKDYIRANKLSNLLRKNSAGRHRCDI